MTTLADLKAEIADDLDRTDIPNQIASEITKAIVFYQTTRFYFNETRDVTFSTVSSQKLYTASDNPNIPKFIELDQVNIEDGTNVCELEEIDPKTWELLTGYGNSSSRPGAWSYFNQSIGLYSVPDQAYAIRLIGHIRVDAPTDDDDEDNVWITEAYDLIRARVCANLGQKKLRDPDVVGLHRAAERDELNGLKAETASRVGTGFVIPSQF